MKIRCPNCDRLVDQIMVYSYSQPFMMCEYCAGRRYNEDRSREMQAADIGVPDGDAAQL